MAGLDWYQMSSPISRWTVICLALAVMATVSPSYATSQNTPAAPVAAPDDAQCTTLFTVDDPRLFDFVTTRRDVSFEPYEGLPIRSIDYITLPIFNEKDPKENNWLYRGANWLHVPTRKNPLKRQVLLREGQVLDRERLRESERILREAQYLYDAMILPATVCPDGIDLLVVVRDVWTLQFTGSISRTGGDNKQTIGFAENNILGYGNAVYMAYDANAERKGALVGFESMSLVDGHTELRLQHADNDDGTAQMLVVQRPFYAIDTPWAAGIEYNRDNKREKIKTADITRNEYAHHTEDGSVYAGMLLRQAPHLAQRLRLGITRERDTYDDQPDDYQGQSLPQDRTLAYPWMEFESVEYDYWTTSNLNQLFRNEDVNLGVNYRVRLGVTSSALDSTERGVISQFAWQKASSFGTHHVLFNTVSTQLFYDQDDNRMEHSVWGFTSTYDHFIDERNRWHVDLMYQAGFHLDPEETFVAGGTVLRGFENNTQRGDRFARINLERRHFYDIHPFNLFRVGSVLFIEAGKVWDIEDRFEQSDKVLVDLGMGLRVSSSKSRPGNVIHVNIAVPLNERDITDKYLVSFYTATAF